jgi:hypothetical protein
MNSATAASPPRSANIRPDFLPVIAPAILCPIRRPNRCVQEGYLVARFAPGHDGCRRGFQRQQSITVFADASRGKADASIGVTMPAGSGGNLVQGSDMFPRARLLTARPPKIRGPLAAMAWRR